MKKVIYKKYGKAQNLQVVNSSEELILKDQEVLIKVISSSMNAIDWKNRQGRFRHFTGLFKPRTKQGFDFFGIVIKAGRNTKVKTGQKVLGLLGNFTGGAFSEQIKTTEKSFITIPDHIVDPSIASFPMASLTAYHALVEIGKIQKGMHILINGGSSGVGTFAIQIAKALGATVTTISSKRNMESCKELGADNTLSYDGEDTIENTSIGPIDIFFDVVNNKKFDEVRGRLSVKPVFIGTTPTFSLIKDVLTKKEVSFVAVQMNKEYLSHIFKLYEENKIKPLIDRTFHLDEIVDAHLFSEKSKTVGKVLIEM